MARDVANAAKNQQQQETQAAQQFGNQASGVYNQLFPELQQEYANPTGLGSSGIAAANTASQDSLGGALASVKGEAANRAARTRNVGSQGALLDSAIQNANKVNATTAAGIQEEDAKLKAQQRQAALSGEGALFGQNVGAEQGLYGAGNSSLNAWNTAAQSPWLGFISNILGTGEQGFGAYEAAH